MPQPDDDILVLPPPIEPGLALRLIRGVAGVFLAPAVFALYAPPWAASAAVATVVRGCVDGWTEARRLFDGRG